MMEFLSDAHIWLVLSFAIFVYVVWSKGKASFIGLLDKRINSIREEISAAEALRQEAQILLNEYQARHRDALSEAATIVADAQHHAKEILLNAEKDMTEAAARREKQLKDRIELMERAARDNLQRYAADLAIKATTEIIAGKMDKDTAEKLIDRSLSEISDNVH